DERAAFAHELDAVAVVGLLDVEVARPTLRDRPREAGHGLDLQLTCQHLDRDPLGAGRGDAGAWTGRLVWLIRRPFQVCGDGAHRVPRGPGGIARRATRFPGSLPRRVPRGPHRLAGGVPALPGGLPG